MAPCFIAGKSGIQGYDFDTKQLGRFWGSGARFAWLFAAVCLVSSHELLQRMLRMAPRWQEGAAARAPTGAGGAACWSHEFRSFGDHILVEDVLIDLILT